MDPKKRLESMLEKSSLVYEKEGERWSVRYDNVDVKIQQHECDTIRTFAQTGIHAAEENTAALLALINHIRGWTPSICEYAINSDGEVIVFDDRRIEDMNSPDRATAIVNYFFGASIDAFRHVDRGGKPHEAVKLLKLNDLRAFLAALSSGVLD